MKSAGYIKSGVCIVMLILLGSYAYLNRAKITTFVAEWDVFVNGRSAPVASIVIDGNVVWKKPMLSTGYFDASGKRQLNYITLRPALMRTLMAQMAKRRGLKVTLGDNAPAQLQINARSQILRAEFPTRAIYFTSDNRLESLAMAAYSERVRGQYNVSCQPESLCRTLRVTSRDWGSVTGPYLKTELMPERRGMPRGRWLVGPRTTLTVRSRLQQRVVMLLNVYALMPDQRVIVSGPGVVNVRHPDLPVETMHGSGWAYYPQSYIVQIDLHAGDNDLVLEYSSMPEPQDEGGPPVAVKLSEIKIKPLN